MPNLDRFRQTRIYQNSVSIPALSQDMAHIATVDHASELEEKRTQKIAGIGVVTAIISLFGGVFFNIVLFSIFPPLGVLGIILIVAGIGGGAIVGGIYLQKSQKAGFLNFATRRDRYQLVKQFSQLWQKDIAPQDKLKITLDLNPVDSSEKFLAEEPLLKRKNGKIKRYRDPYLKVKGKLLDGNKFYLQITERYQVRTWTNVNGKHRVRPRVKGFDILFVLSYSQDLYPLPPQLERNLDSAVKLPATVIFKQLQTKPGKLRLKVKVPPVTSLQNKQRLLFQTVTMMFLSSYQMLNLARMITADQPA